VKVFRQLTGMKPASSFESDGLFFSDALPYAYPFTLGGRTLLWFRFVDAAVGDLICIPLTMFVTLFWLF